MPTASLLLVMAIGAMSLAVLAARWNRRCKQCGGATANLKTPDETTWELLWCDPCERAVPLAGGRQDALAWCAGCLQRSVQIKVRPGPVGSSALGIQERCHLCGLERDHELQVALAPRGLVLPFQQGRSRRR